MQNAATVHSIIKSDHLARSAGTTNKGQVSIDAVSLSFGKGKEAFTAVEATSLEIKPGEFVCILGPSGCGKSSLLNCVAGYVKPASGAIRVDGQSVTGPSSDRGMVFQQYSLFPWKTIRENVAFGPRMANASKASASATANTFLALVGLSKFANKYPGELSGGMQQRVGIARALANYPSVLLMDEPFGALDAQTRTMMQNSLLEIWSEFKTTVMFVTHDVDEAIFLADRVVIMSASPGRVIADLSVELPRPRTADMVTDDVFVHLKRECLNTIRAETMKVFSEQTD
ncbi:MAG: ABC transporter ATP-binding protein [Pseudomonadales bacterium]|nr:ABC transporter ATP-binding protein [Pseudomonadales bacterium]